MLAAAIARHMHACASSLRQANDEDAIRRLAERFPVKIRKTFEGLFDSYIREARASPASRRPHSRPPSPSCHRLPPTAPLLFNPRR